MSKWVLRDYQEKAFEKALPILLRFKMVYLAMEERTGKSIVALALGNAVKARSVLIVTKKGGKDKKVLRGWEETLKNFAHKFEATLVNYQAVKKLPKNKSYDLIIVDEPHSHISAFPKRSKTWMDLRSRTGQAMIIFSSATPHAQGYHQLYNQLAISNHSPFHPIVNPYDWFQKYAMRDKEGQVQTVKINATTSVVDYKAVRGDMIKAKTDHLFVTLTRTDAGFEHEPEDELHYIELEEHTKLVYNTLIKDKALSFELSSTGKEYDLICDTPISLRWACHQLEGGALKINNEYINLGNNEKVEYILKTWGDTEELVIMYQYKADLIKLQKFFKKAVLLQASTYAEGIDLYEHAHLVIYSQDFSTAKHTQRRARQANLKRDTPITVHYLLVKKAVSEQVYKTVSVNKEDFVDSRFERVEL